MLLKAKEYPALDESFLADVLAGLSQSQKTLPCKYLYDETGSRLFNGICELDEYYPTRTETRILCEHMDAITQLIGKNSRLVEFGSGTSTKTRHLLRHLPEISSYVPIDIAGSQLRESAARLSEEFPRLTISPVEADYSKNPELPRSGSRAARTVAFFPGSTIGNFQPVAAVEFLKSIASMCGPDGALLIGVDLKKPRATLEAAYNDHCGVTADFNLNLLSRVNRELGADFDLSSFRHHAPFNERLGRIEMHLISSRSQAVRVNDHEIIFHRHESILTEFSYKYTVPGFAALARRAGFDLVKSWVDERNLFGILFLATRNAREKAQK